MVSYLGEQVKKIVIFDGKAKIGEIMGGLASIQLKPEDFSSPIALQMAFSRIYEGVIKALEEGPKKKYVAEVRMTDSLGNQVVIGVDLGEAPPPFSKSEVKARITVEIFEEEDV
ncbi:MAG: hypothetical protein ACP5I2_02185 [Fervidicoccaceae archaeon]|jgi:hypothetical protein